MHFIADNVSAVEGDLLTFKDFMKAVCSDLSYAQLNSMLEWIDYTGEFFVENAPKRRRNKKLTTKTIFRYRRMFEKIDKNQTGVVTMDGLKDKFNKAIGPNNLEVLVSEYDKEQKNGLNFKQFVRMLTPREIEKD